MTAEQGKRPYHKLDVVQALGIPLALKYEFIRELNDAASSEIEQFREKYGPPRQNRPRVSQDSAHDDLLVEFQAPILAHHEEVLDPKRSMYVDEAGNPVGILFREVSSGVSLQDIPQPRSVGRMLKRRGITVTQPERHGK